MKIIYKESVQWKMISLTQKTQEKIGREKMLLEKRKSIVSKYWHFNIKMCHFPGLFQFNFFFFQLTIRSSSSGYASLLITRWINSMLRFSGYRTDIFLLRLNLKKRGTYIGGKSVLLSDSYVIVALLNFTVIKL